MFHFLDIIMNSDHIDYQQHLQQAVDDDDESKSQQPSLQNNPILSNNQNQTFNLDLLTPTQRRERISTLVIIAFIALLTGNEF
jgi:hypothetical protein